MPEIKFLPNYDLIDNSGTLLLNARSRQQQVRPTYDTEVGGVTKGITVSLKAIVMEVRSVNVSQLITKLEEERRKNQELTSKLRELERAHSFMPSKPHLPNGYFSDLLDEDEYYD